MFTLCCFYFCLIALGCEAQNLLNFNLSLVIYRYNEIGGHDRNSDNGTEGIKLLSRKLPLLQKSLVLPEIILNKEAIISANESDYWLENDDNMEVKANRSIIRNISLVLDNLFKDYDQSQRPGQGGAPTVISTNFHVKSMGPISELEMTYQMDCYFRQSWLDERLKFDAPVNTISLNIKMLEGIWKPDTYFHNGQKAYIHTITIPNKMLRIEKDGKVLFSTRLTIKAKCPMQLHRFPMDKQSCPLIFGSYAYSVDQVLYVWDSDNAIRLDKTMTMSQFDLVGSPRSNMTVQMRRGLFSTLQVNFNLKRHAGYFLIQVYVPCVLIVVLSWVSFWINREATSDRVGLGITTVLTLSTFGVDTRNDLPKVHYATALDWFVIICFSFVIASLLEFAGVHYFTKVGSGELLDDNDIDETIEADDENEWEDVEINEINGDYCTEENNEKSSLAYIVDCDVDDLGSPLESARLKSSENKSCSDSTQTELNRACCVQFFYCLLGNDTYRAKMRHYTEGVNSVSKIDQVSRLLFPITFAVLNLFYWVSLTSDALNDNRIANV